MADLHLGGTLSINWLVGPQHFSTKSKTYSVLISAQVMTQFSAQNQTKITTQNLTQTSAQNFLAIFRGGPQIVITQLIRGVKA